MDKQTSSSALASVRTFAKDMAKKRALTEVATETKSADQVSAPQPVPKAEPQIYRAPSLSDHKSKPAAKPEPEVKTEKPATVEKKLEAEAVAEPQEEQTLKPISAPKTEGETIIVDSTNTRPGVIITDSKRNRFRLFPAIFQSINQWFAELKQRRIAKKTPKYTVPETSHRKGVIQKATSKTGKFTSADALSIHERIRQRKERAVPKTPVTIWTANTEPGYPLLEPEKNKISNVQVVLKRNFLNLPEVAPVKVVAPEIVVPPVVPKKITPPPAPTIVSPVIKKIPTPIVVVPPTPKIVAPTPVLPTTPEPVVVVEKPAVATVVDVPVEREPVATVAPVETPIIYGAKGITRLTPTNLKEWLFSNSINTISIGVSLAVVVFIILSATSYFWVSSKMPNLSSNNTPKYQTLIETPLQLVYPQTLTRAGLFEDIIESFKNAEGDVNQQIFVASAKGETLLKPEAVMSTLDFKLEPAFIKSVSYIYFGGLGKNVPFILLDIADYTTARGGMLNWETTMYQDLSPLLNYNQLYDNGSIMTAVFTDSMLDKNDVRVLRTLAGSELLVYGLVNKDTVIITTNSTAFTEITKLLK